MTYPGIETQRTAWAAALTLPDQPDLRASLVAELAEYLGRPVVQVEARCRRAAAELAEAWHAAAPDTPAAVAAFYQHADTYLYDLTWWHSLNQDDSALVQAEALQLALAYGARTALDFGSGIGSLGLLLAQHGIAVTLADVNPCLNDYARWRFARRGLAANIIDLPAPDVQADTIDTRVASVLPANAFDFISAVDVFEHLPHPEATLADLSAALRPGGVLFIHLPPAPDTTHPMHLWYDPQVLLRHLPRCGLWLERGPRLRGDGPMLILRRGDGPRYALQPGLELLPDADSGVLLSLQPLVAIRLNAQAYRLLACLDGGGTATDLATRLPELPLTDIMTFLDTLTHRRLLTRQPVAPLHWPAVSIIIPAHGRPAATRACVMSLLALDYPPERIELIVVDDASDPPLAPALAGLPVRLLRQETNIGQSAARNLAAGAARGALLAFIDNDCVADPAWLRTLVPHIDSPAISIVGGRVLAPPPDGPVAAFEAVRSPLDMGACGGEVGHAEAVAYMPTCNLVVRRDVLLTVGGFAAEMRLGEDVDFIWRVLRAGGRARYVPEATIIHDHRVQVGALLRRRAAYGSSEADLQRRHPAGRRVMVLPVVVLSLVLASVVWAAAWPVSLFLVTLATIGFLAQTGQKLRQVRQSRVRLPRWRVIRAVLLAHGASLYHLSAHVTRYYSLPLLAAGLVWPALLPAAVVLFLVPPVVDHHRRRPRVSLPRFIGLYWLEMAAYQVGVWRGCRTWWTLRPLLPILRLRW